MWNQQFKNDVLQSSIYRKQHKVEDLKCQRLIILQSIVKMRSLKILKSLQQELQTLPKLYSSHVWITSPGSDGLSFLGISDYAKKYFVRLNKLDIEIYPKTLYGIANRQRIKYFIDETKQRKEKGQLFLSEQRQWQRFEYRQGQSFATLQTIEFDVELKSPIDMRIVEFELQSRYKRVLLSSLYYFRVQPLNLKQLDLLDNEQKYNKSVKMIF